MLIPNPKLLKHFYEARSSKLMYRKVEAVDRSGEFESQQPILSSPEVYLK